MIRGWRHAAIKAISRNDHRNALAGAVAGLGGAIAIGVMLSPQTIRWRSFRSRHPSYW